MTDLRELYQEVILDHNKNPRNFRKMEQASLTARGNNPLCGDKLEVFLDVAEGKINDISFLGSGCAISKASASMMTATLKGKTLEEAKTLFESFHNLVTGKETDPSSLKKLSVFSGVCEFPARVKCAILAWHTFNATLERKPSISTEGDQDPYDGVS